MSRLNRLNNVFIKLEKIKPLNASTFDLTSFEECKKLIRNLSINGTLIA